jgi:arginine repressor
MVEDSNVRTLPQVLAIAKAIIEKGKEKEVVEACSGRDTYFVVATEDSRAFIASFLNEHQINPNDVDLHTFRYGRARCS